MSSFPWLPMLLGRVAHHHHRRHLHARHPPHQQRALDLVEDVIP